MDWTSLCCVWRCSYHSYPTRRNRVPRTLFGHLVGVGLDAPDAAARISGVWVRRSRFRLLGLARRGGKRWRESSSAASAPQISAAGTLNP